MGSQQPSLGPELYNKDYYLKSLPGLEYIQKDIVDPAILETIKFGAILPEDRVLDFGCGRGNLAVELAKRGSYAVGVDFSKDAIEYTQSYLKRFPEEIQNRWSGVPPRPIGGASPERWRQAGSDAPLRRFAG